MVAVLVMPPLATVIVAWFSPGFAFVVSTLAVMVPLFSPEDSLSESHEAAPCVVTVHAPFELMVRFFGAGSAESWVAVKERLFDERVKEPVDSIRVTPTVLVVLPAVTEMAAVLVFADISARSTFATIVPLPVPEVLFNLSQAALTLAVQLPFAVTVTDWLAGLEPPDTPV